MYLTVNLIYFYNSLGCFFPPAKTIPCCLLMRILVKHRVALAGQILGLTPHRFPFLPFKKLIGLKPRKQLESRGTQGERFMNAWWAHIISSYFGVSKSPLVFESILIIRRKYCLLKKLHLHFKVKLKKIILEFPELGCPTLTHIPSLLPSFPPSFSLPSPYSFFPLHISFFLQKVSFSSHDTMTVRNKRIR